MFYVRVGVNHGTFSGVNAFMLRNIFDIFVCEILQIPFKGCNCGQDILPVGSHKDQEYGDCNHQA